MDPVEFRVENVPTAIPGIQVVKVDRPGQSNKCRFVAVDLSV